MRLNIPKVILTILAGIVIIMGLIFLVSCSNTNVPKKESKAQNEAGEEPEVIRVNVDVPDEYNALFTPYVGEKTKDDATIIIGILKQVGLTHIKSVHSYIKGTLMEAYESENNDQSYMERLDEIAKEFEDVDKFYIKTVYSEDGFITQISISDTEDFVISVEPEEPEEEDE